MKNEDKELKSNGTPRIPFSKSAKLSKEDGSKTIFFVDKDYGLKNGLSSKMNFKILHPTRPNLCEITIPIERIE